MVSAFFLLLWKARKLPPEMFTNRLSVVIFLHVLWIGITSLLSSYPMISLKFFLAKLWYVIPFFFLPLMLLKVDDLKKLFKLLLIATMVAASYVMVRHAGMGFAFEEVNQAVRPIFRNHVNYAALLVLLVPFVWALYRIEKKLWLLFALMFLLVATYLTYTRAAQGVLILCIPMYFVFKFRLMKIMAPLGIIVITIMLAFFINQNRYLNFAPQYEKTITHTKFDNLLEATYKLEDISTMERLYRWVAGFRMVRERPFVGFGPATFYSNYEAYTVSSFQTYVSDNPEKSGIHNYYLMCTVEQGFFGLVLILVLILTGLFYAESLFHKLAGHENRYWALAAGFAIFITAVLLTINDLLEADKVGPLFFLSFSMMWILGREDNKQEAQAHVSPPKHIN